MVSLVDASFDGVLVKTVHSGCGLRQAEEEEPDEQPADRRKTKVCYSVLKLVKCGELFQFLESSERFSQSLARTLFSQLIDGKPPAR